VAEPPASMPSFSFAGEAIEAGGLETGGKLASEVKTIESLQNA